MPSLTGAAWPSHPYAARDSLHEAGMWAVEGLTHRYPAKVLAEILPTCPQYCGHRTRMDLAGNPTPVIGKHRFVIPRADRLAAMIGSLKRAPQVRDVGVSGGDVANMPWPRLENFVRSLLGVDNIRDVRLASKALMGCRSAGSAMRRGRAWPAWRRPHGSGASASPSTPT